MNKTSQLILLLLFFFLGCTNKENNLEHSTNKLELPTREQYINIEVNPVWDSQIIKPITWGTVLNDNIKNKDILKDTANLHPLDIGRTTLFLLYYIHDNPHEEQIKKLTKDYLDFLKNYPYAIDSANSKVYLYPFSHNELKAKQWWSAMANSVIALSFLYGYNEFHDTTYLEEAIKAINGTVRPNKENGSATILGKDQIWYNEYAAADKDSGYFVLNGFLFALENIYLFYKSSGLEQYKNYYQYGQNALKKLNNEYYYKDKKWTFYMLKPLTIESTHYAIFDLMLYKSLYKLTNDRFYYEQIQTREQILKTNYQPEIANNHLFFSLVGAPHPYWIDTYGIILQLTGKDSTENIELMNPRSFNRPVLERGFEIFKLKNGYDYINVYAKYGNDTIKIYSVAIKDIPKVQYKIDTLKATTTIAPENGTNQDYYKFSPSDRDTIKFVFEQSQSLNQYAFFGFILNSELELNSLRIIVLDEKGHDAERYYIKPEANRDNLILLVPTGFRRYNNVDFNKIKEIRLLIYPSETNKPNTIKKIDILGFDNKYSLFTLLKNNGQIVFPENKHEYSNLNH